MAKKNRPSVLKRQRERRKAERKEAKRLDRLRRREEAETAKNDAEADDQPTDERSDGADNPDGQSL